VRWRRRLGPLMRGSPREGDVRVRLGSALCVSVPLQLSFGGNFIFARAFARGLATAIRLAQLA